MSGYRKLSRKSDQRRALLKNQVTSLLVNGHLTTTDARAEEVQKIAERLITLAIKEHKNYDSKEVEVSSAKLDGKGKKLLESRTSKSGAHYDVVQREKGTKLVQVDHPSRLAARRQLLSYMYEMKDQEGKRINTVNYLFNEVAPRYVDRKGGYTRIIKLGARRGDGANMVKLELV
ncbi:MAG: L17 family ribosomal protein [Eubacteriales bacterium]|nr:L17 family ribosomal protein [Eubacteriales bacterium]